MILVRKYKGCGQTNKTGTTKKETQFYKLRIDEKFEETMLIRVGFHDRYSITKVKIVELQVHTGGDKIRSPASTPN